MGFLLSVAVAYIIGAFPLQRGMFLRSSPYGKGGNQRIYVMVMEMIKGAVATLLALLIGSWLSASFAAIFVVLGSMYSIFLGFKGDRGVAVATGALLVLSPLLFLIGVGVFLLLLLVTKYFDLATLVATVIVMIVAVFFVQHVYVWVGTICVGSLLLCNQRIDWGQIKGKWKLPFFNKK